MFAIRWCCHIIRSYPFHAFAHFAYLPPAGCPVLLFQPSWFRWPASGMASLPCRQLERRL